MQRAISVFLIVVCFGVYSNSAYSQGCSDAGFCTMGAMRPDQAYSKRIAVKLRSVSVDFYRGKSLLTPVIYVATIDMTFGLNDKNFFQIKLPYQYAEGSLGELGGMGDISLSFTHTLKATNEWSLNGTLGGKIPMGDGNGTVNNEFTGNVDAPIHMYYQPSLGTYDIVAGVSWISEKWLVATGIQIPLNETENNFKWSNFPDYPSPEYVRKYNVGPNLKRGTDVMLRVERNWRFTNYNFSFGLLPIWRITEDNTLIAPDFTEREDREGTTGLALSVLASFGYQFDVKSGVRYIYGLKLVDRDFNPDGLTRKTVNTISYTYKF